MNKIKIVLSGLVFPFTMMHFFWRALERRSDIDLLVVGPFFGNDIPWAGGIRLPQKYVKVPHIPLPKEASRFMMPSTMIQRSLPWKPDLWLEIDAGWHTCDKPDAGCVALIETDPHVLKLHYEVPKQYSDITFCMQYPYKYPDEEYLPYAYDPEIHYPENQEKIYDACLIGLHYATRDALVNRLRQKGLNVYYSIGDVYDEYRNKYNQSKVALSWSSLQDLPARFFEGLAMGLPVVSNIVPDIERNGFIDGQDFLGFRTIDEAENQILRLLHDEELLDKIAISGYNKVKEHTWDMRVQQVLRRCGLL